jgi:hypothetical protein
MMSGQVFPSAVVQHIVDKFLTNGKVKPDQILKRPRGQFDDETLSRTQAYGWSKSFKEGRTEVENMRKVCLLQGK